MSYIRSKRKSNKRENDDLRDIGASIPNKKTKTKRKKKKSKSSKKKIKYYKYINSKAWRRKKKEALKHHGKKCQICGSEEELTVHHKTYARLGREKMKDLQILCVDCHGIEHEDKHLPLDPLSCEYRAIVG